MRPSPLVLALVTLGALLAASPAWAQEPEQPDQGAWSAWALEAAPGSTLLESETTVRAMLEPTMRLRPEPDEIEEAASKIGYHVQQTRQEASAGGGSTLILVLQPLPVIRRVEIHLDQWSRLSIKEDLQRRLGLRVGDVLTPVPEDREEALKRERERLTEFLQDEGFFEATVKLRPVRSGNYGVVLHVDASLGPEYYPGEITIMPNGPLAFTRTEIRRVFDHCRLRAAGKCYWRKRFTRAQHQADIAQLTAMYQKRGYPAARVRSTYDPSSFDRSRQVVDFQIRIDERRRLAVEFEGNDPGDFSDEDLTQLLTFDDSAAADDVEVNASALAIQRHYQQRGWFDAAVSWERDRKRIEGSAGDKSFDLIRYRIDPGEPRVLRTVELVGVKQLSESDLRAVMQTRATPGAFRLLGGAGLTPATTEQLDGDVARITDLYRSKGYLEATVRVTASPSASSLDDAATTAALLGAERDARDLHVRFTIVEGEPTVVGQVKLAFEGTPQATREQILAQLAIKEGSPFIVSELQEARGRLESWYWGLGKPRAKVSLDYDRTDPHRITAIYTIDERQELRVGKVVVRGNFRTARWVILDELDLDEGEPITDDLLAGAKRRVRGTGLFNAVKLDPVDLETTRDERVNIVVHVEEREDVRAYIDFEGGFSDQKSSYLKGAVILPNPFHNGISASVGLTGGADLADLSKAYEAEEFSLRFPRWWVRRGLGIAPDIELSGFRRVQDTERFGELETYNVTLAASRTWQRDPEPGVEARALSATLRTDFRVRNREEDAVRVAGNNGTSDVTSVTNRASAVGIDLTWDQRVDARGNLNPLSPDHGFKLGVSASLAARIKYLGQDDFVKLSGLGQWIHPLGDRVQVRIEGRYDHGIPLGDAVLLPEVERFFAGGDETVRGFDEDRLLTEIIETPVPPFGGVTQVEVLPAGGNIRMLGSIDLQVKLWSLGSLPVASALFVDAGAITNGLSALEPNDIRPSVGVALARLLTPFGGLSLEWAMPMLPREHDPPLGRLHFLVALRY